MGKFDNRIDDVAWCFVFWVCVGKILVKVHGTVQKTCRFSYRAYLKPIHGVPVPSTGLPWCIYFAQKILRRIHPASLDQPPTCAMLGGQLPAPRRSRVVTADVFFSTRAQRCEPLQVRWCHGGRLFLCFPENSGVFPTPQIIPYWKIVGFPFFFKTRHFFGGGFPRFFLETPTCWVGGVWMIFMGLVSPWN